jgi:catechol 2,3-dioxygenase-like lactoylglutathione lyase family enzyme
MCVDGKISGLDHVQLAMPPCGEELARAYFGGLLGLVELEKPAALAGRGGVWFRLPEARQIHLGVEEPIRPNKKAHPAFRCAALDDLAQRLGEGGYAVRWDDALASRRRFYSEDPFGNRIEYTSRIFPWRDIMLLAS